MTATEIASRLLAKDFHPDDDRLRKAKALAARYQIEWADVVKASQDLLTTRVSK